MVARASASRVPSERQDNVERFYKAYEDRVREAPAGHGMDYVHIYLICSKM